MIKYTVFAAGLVFAQLAFATNTDNIAVVTAKDQAVMVTTNKTTWSVVATSTKGLTKVREFHDMGASGVQQIDYVVNCTNGTLALADFAVLTVQGRLPVRAVEPTFDSLSFYKPLIEHDVKVANNACESHMALNGSRTSE
jgi:hypothetical protein